jgi:putative ABC transport system permease protein
MSGAAIRVIARNELRRGWKSLVVVGVLAGLVGAMAISTISLARRTATAYTRLSAATSLEDARGRSFGDASLVDRVVELPEVVERWTGSVAVGQLEGSMQFIGLIAGPDEPSTLLQPVVVTGRMPHDDAPDEIVITEMAANAMNVHTGAHLPLRFLTQVDFNSFDTGFPGGRPNGPVIEISVVGTVKLAGGSTGTLPALAGPGFARAHPDALLEGRQFFVRLKGGPSSYAAFATRVDVIVGEVAVAQPSGESDDEFRPFELEDPHQADTAVSTTALLLSRALLLTGALLTLAGALAVRQAFGRRHVASAADRAVEGVLGLTASHQRLARLLVATAPGLVAAAIAVAGAVAASGIAPIGGMRIYEPRPGRAPNVTIIGIGAVATALAVVALAATSGVFRRAPTIAPERDTSLSQRSTGLRLSPPASVGLRFALDRRGGGRAVPMRVAGAGAALGVAGVIGVAVFAASLNRLADSPSRQGVGYDFLVADVGLAQLDQIALDDRLSTVLLSSTGQVNIEGQIVDAHAAVSVRGRLAIDLAAGRLPSTASDVVLGLRLARQLDKAVGDSVTIDLVDGETRQMTVVGLGVIPVLNNEQLGRNALLTTRGLDLVSLVRPTTGGVIAVGDATLRPDVIADLSQRFELILRATPPDVDNLRQLGRLPEVVGSALALIALVGLVNAFVAVVHRRRHDLAVLRALGFTPRQTARSVLVMALTIAVIGTAVGTPTGLIVGRAVWRAAANGAAVVDDPVVEPGIVAAVVVSTVLVALAAAGLPALRASRRTAASALSGE